MGSSPHQYLVLSSFKVLAILIDAYLGLFFLLHYSFGDGGGRGGR